MITTGPVLAEYVEFIFLFTGSFSVAGIALLILQLRRDKKSPPP